ncbi:hypothetical protein GCM10029964_039650 [Kibdelosporangium lantanae]
MREMWVLPDRADRYAPRVFLNVVDVEATCWEGRPPAGQVNEIIEIGLTVVDLDTRERTAKHRILVRPQRSEVSEFCTELTGLTQAEVDTGVTFAEACRTLAKEHRAGKLGWASWGDYDRKQFTRQCDATNVTYPFGQRHTNAKATFAKAYDLPRPVGMAQALDIAELPSKAGTTGVTTTRGTSRSSCSCWPTAVTGPGSAGVSGSSRWVFTGHVYRRHRAAQRGPQGDPSPVPGVREHR